MQAPGPRSVPPVQARECSLQHADMRVGLDGVDYAKLAGLSDEVRGSREPGAEGFFQGLTCLHP